MFLKHCRVYFLYSKCGVLINEQDAFSEEDKDEDTTKYVSTEELSNYLAYMRRERDAQMNEMARAQKELDGLIKYALYVY